MNKRKELINAIVTGDVKRLKKLTNEPLIYLISAPRNGKYFSLSLNKDVKDVEISLAEIAELKKCHTVICLTEADGCVTSDVRTSEDQVTD
jgi:hypothetical protein